MSAPVSRFQKLSLSQDMQSHGDLAPAQSGGKGKGKAPMGSGGSASLAQILNPNESDDEMGQEEAPDDVQEEVPDEGTRSGRVFALNHCRQFDTFYAFQIAYAEVERISIRISTTGPICSSNTCSGGEQCCHIEWLLEQLSNAIPDTLEVTDITTYEQISAVGLDTVCEELQFELREGPESDTEDTWQLKKVHSTSGLGRQTRRMLKERMHAVRDIMATLSSDTLLTDDYRGDIFNTPGDMSPKLILGDLEATISRLLFSNDDMFYHFKTLVPKDLRARSYFTKALLKAQATIAALDKYAEQGPVDGPFDLIWCADTLIKLVDSINFNIVQRQPLSSVAKQEAAKALVGILDMVINRNYEIYPKDPSWSRRRAHAEPTRDRNLYERLIRSPPENRPVDFVLSALQNLPEAKPYIDQLQGLLGILKQIGWSSPEPYKIKLGGIIEQLRGVPPNAIPRAPQLSSSALEPGERALQAAPSLLSAAPSSSGAGPSTSGAGPSTSSGKRPAKSSDRKANKRMK
ncbi:uncharacterized protein LY89DRAFT_680481 [Mollisia scopiformis]|uniref:SWIM-type domain-containing protein n=1 Tax=Mollisia scopiformis TaxID=149040 RepID=A0A194XQ15_MOLSC|nr:uncharacterized protein LY89DRAFT_680481 [Mollisia scopiformis]KUJ22350.1 hypothetical protein LY89DRAFT_680481 [Mollisia scopiformis]